MDGLRGVGIHEGRIWIGEGGGLLVIIFAVTGLILLSSSEALLLGTMNDLDYDLVCIPHIDGEN